ncbi:MAG: glycosyltransferase family 2 protein [Candidatus Hadarchaeales archaeon]
MRKEEVWIVIPAYNEERSVGRVLEELKKRGWKNLLVVDDGSSDATGKVAREAGAVVIRHEVNSGLGAALRTGLREAFRRGAKAAVTFDADGQHDPDSVEKIVEALEGADFVVGKRRSVGIPLNKRLGNFLLDVLTFLLSGIFTDSQSGNRGFSRKALGELEIESNRYAVSSEFILQASKKGWRVREVPVKCFYHEYSKAKGTTILSGFRIFLSLLAQEAREWSRR